MVKYVLLSSHWPLPIHMFYCKENFLLFYMDILVIGD